MLEVSVLCGDSQQRIVAADLLSGEIRRPVIRPLIGFPRDLTCGGIQFDYVNPFDIRYASYCDINIDGFRPCTPSSLLNSI